MYVLWSTFGSNVFVMETCVILQKGPPLPLDHFLPQLRQQPPPQALKTGKRVTCMAPNWTNLTKISTSNAEKRIIDMKLRQVRIFHEIIFLNQLKVCFTCRIRLWSPLWKLIYKDLPIINNPGFDYCIPIHWLLFEIKYTSCLEIGSINSVMLKTYSRKQLCRTGVAVYL